MLKTRILDAVIEKGILFLIIFTPLAFGSVQEWASAVMELAAYIILAAWISKSRGGEAIEIRDWRLLAPLIGLVGVVLFQMLPLPSGIMRILSPATADLYREFGAPGNSSWKTISIYPWATKQELLRILAYCSVFFVIINHYRSREQVNSLIRTIIGMAVFLALLALLQKAAWNGRMLWIFPVSAQDSYGTSLSIWGPYINRNHFAGYLEMVIPLAVAVSFLGMARIESARVRGWTMQLYALGRSRQLPRIVLSGLTALFLVAVLFATLSRGGIIACLASLLVFAGLVLSRQSLKKRAGVVIVLGAALFLVVLSAGWERIEARFDLRGLEQGLERAIVLRDSAGVVRDFPLWGTGLGTFQNIYQKYQTHSALILYDHAHNDYMELLTDLGGAGFALLALLAAVYGTVVTGKWKRRHRTKAKVLGAGGLASLAAMSVHSLMDFNLRIPANAMLFTIIAGLTYAVVMERTGTEEGQWEAE